jgi:hypothetical protein
VAPDRPTETDRRAQVLAAPSWSTSSSCAPGPARVHGGTHHADAHARPLSSSARCWDAHGLAEDQHTPALTQGAGGFLAEHLRSDQIARVIYGAIVGLALVVAIEPHPPAAAAVAAILVTTAIAVALAELYSDVVATRIRLRGPLGKELRREAEADVLAVAAGAGFPAVFFLLAAAGAIELDTAFALAKWSGLGLIAAYGYAAGRLSGAAVGRSVLHALAVGAIGAGVILVKAVVH